MVYRFLIFFSLVFFFCSLVTFVKKFGFRFWGVIGYFKRKLVFVFVERVTVLEDDERFTVFCSLVEFLGCKGRCF